MNCEPPLTGLRVVEFGSIGPGPHCAMLLSDLGAEVLRIDREGGNGWLNPIIDRGRASLVLDLRSEEGRMTALELLDHCDVSIEGMRPGVMERLGLGPEVGLKRNPRLIYGRMTGWGQEGPMAHVAGHDITYIALTGALAAMGPNNTPPPPPLNLVGDFGGGSLYLAVGILAALRERERSGEGQVVDAAIIDGVSSMMTMFAGLLPANAISMDRQRNVLCGAAPFYRCYSCSDGKYIAVGALEPKFYAELLSLLGLPAELIKTQYDEASWPESIALLTDIFGKRPRDEWAQMFELSDACVAPVLELDEAPSQRQLAARQSYVTHNGLMQAAPAPRFSRTPGKIGKSVEGRDLMRSWGMKVEV